MELISWWHHKKSEVEKSTSDFLFYFRSLCVYVNIYPLAYSWFSLTTKEGQQ